eukprot:3663708-Amphidinium_carterae.1
MRSADYECNSEINTRTHAACRLVQYMSKLVHVLSIAVLSQAMIKVVLRPLGCARLVQEAVLHRSCGVKALKRPCHG